jgi:hypothetical protein
MSNQNPFERPQDPNQAGPYGFTPMQPVTPPRKTSAWLIIGLITVPLLFMMCVCAGLLLPAVQAAREAARRMSCSNNIKQIGLAMHNYHSTHQSLPPAYTVDENGKPLHSWRTLLLPYLEQQALYNQIDLSKPWDDPVNMQVSLTAVPTYSCPSSGELSNLTTYVAVVDAAGLMTGETAMSFSDATDGISNTLLIMEADPSLAVPWMSPQDVTANEFINVSTAGRRGGHTGGAHVLMSDGAVQFITDDADASIRKEMLNRNDQK